MIFFDLDDTLLDHAASKGAGLRALARYGLPGGRTPEAFAPEWDALCDGFFQKYADGIMGYREQRVARMRALWPDLPEDEAARRLEECNRAEIGAWTLFADAVPCLEALAPRGLGVITNGDDARQRAKLERTGIAGRFAVVVVSGSAGVAKPDPEIFRLACRLAGEPPEACVHVGDRFDKDPVAAAASGLTGVWIRRDGARSADPRVPAIRTLAELPALLARG